MKKILFFILLLIGCNLRNTKNVMEKPQNKVIKNYVFCRCLSNIYPDFNNNFSDGSIATYDFQLQSTEKIDTFINVWLSKNKYRSVEDNALGVQRCLDLYNSKALDSVIGLGQVNLIKIE
jgi:hypothetical protein